MFDRLVGSTNSAACPILIGSFFYKETIVGS